MSKQITFNNNDQKLIKQIVEFQKSSGLPSFVSAVRKLCEDALQLKKNNKMIGENEMKKHIKLLTSVLT
ncbi:MAG: hypothetical protein IJV87_00100 [Clostridia bacterium]|nr:hypothetical protein [Clostridia bacterium]